MLKQLLLNRGRRLLLKFRDWKGRRLEKEVVIAETRLWRHRMKYENPQLIPSRYETLVEVVTEIQEDSEW